MALLYPLNLRASTESAADEDDKWAEAIDAALAEASYSDTPLFPL